MGRGLAVYAQLEHYSEFRNRLWHHASGALRPAIEARCGPDPHGSVVRSAEEMARILNKIAVQRFRPTVIPVNPYPVLYESVRKTLASHEQFPHIT